MTRVDWNRWLAHEGDELLTWLHDCEDAAKRGLHGIWLILVMTIPELFRDLLGWLRQKFIYAGRVATRLGRIVGLILLWLLIVGGPLSIYPGLITGAWVILAVTGSWLGVQHQFKNRNRASTGVRAVSNGR